MYWLTDGQTLSDNKNVVPVAGEDALCHFSRMAAHVASIIQSDQARAGARLLKGWYIISRINR